MTSALAVPRDEMLPQLETIMDISIMEKKFQEELFTVTSDDPLLGPETEKFQIRGCRIESIRYRPGRNCMVCYRVSILEKGTGQVVDQVLSTTVYKPEEARSRYMKAKSQDLVMPKFGRPLTLIPELGMVIWAFPNDRKLGGLSKITNVIYLKNEVLPGIIKNNFCGDWEIETMTNEVVQYVPEHSCTVRVHLQLHTAQKRTRKVVTFYGKSYSDKDGATSYKMMDQLWESESRCSGQLRMAQPLEYFSGTKALWQLGLSGVNLLEKEKDHTEFLGFSGRAASVVAALHQTSLTCSKSIHLNDLLTKLQEIKRVLPQGRSSCKEVICPLIDRLVLQAGDLKEKTVATLHGDLHLNNFIVEADDVFLIDMDNLKKGDPLIDLGSFVAFLIYRGILSQIPGQVTYEFIETFIQEYERRVSWEVSKSELKWHVVVSLLNERAFRCLTRLKVGRLDILTKLLELSDYMSKSPDDILEFLKGEGKLNVKERLSCSDTLRNLQQ